MKILLEDCGVFSMGAFTLLHFVGRVAPFIYCTLRLALHSPPHVSSRPFLRNVKAQIS